MIHLSHTVTYVILIFLSILASNADENAHPEDGTFNTALDEVGNTLGGLRLPHLEQVIDGTVAGAPLGRYTGKHPDAGPDDFFWLGGYFKPFTDEELTELGYAGSTPNVNTSEHDNNSQNPVPLGRLVPVGDGVELYYEKSGKGEPLVLLHFFSGSTIIWEPFLDELTRHFKVINIDMRGHGRSGILTGDFLHRESARDVITLLDSIGIDHFRAAGMSSGAMTLLHIAKEWPERIDAMVLVGGTHRYTEESRQIHNAPDCADLSDTAMETWRSRHIHGENQIYALLNAWCGFSEVMGEDMNLSSDSLANIQARTLIIHGDSDSYFPVEIPVEMYKGIPNAALWVVPNGSHLPVFDPGVRTEFLQQTLEFFLAGD